MSFFEKQVEYARGHKRPIDAEDWDQMCGNLMFRFGVWYGWATVPTGNIDSAYRVAMASGWLNPDAAKAPVGAWHYFDIAGPNNGHVMQDGRGGGSTCLMAGWSLHTQIGEAIGFQSVWGYVAEKNATYLGWATNYAGGTQEIEQPAPPTPTPEPTPTPTPLEEGSNMAQRSYFARVRADGTDDGEWMLAGVDIPPLNEKGTEEERKQDGYRITNDIEVARVWARAYSYAPEERKAVHLTRDLYIKQQVFAREDAKRNRAFQRSLIIAALVEAGILAEAAK